MEAGGMHNAKEVQVCPNPHVMGCFFKTSLLCLPFNIFMRSLLAAAASMFDSSRRSAEFSGSSFLAPV